MSTSNTESSTATDGSLENAAKERLSRAKERLGECAGETLEATRRLESQIEALVKDHPVSAVLVTAGCSAVAGALLGYVLTRK